MNTDFVNARLRSADDFYEAIMDWDVNTYDDLQAAAYAAFALEVLGYSDDSAQLLDEIAFISSIWETEYNFEALAS